MRVLAQVVSHAAVGIDGKEVAKIGKGLLLFVGFKDGDDEKTLMKMADKVRKLRVFPDGNGKTNLSVKDIGGELLSVSQFTLYASLKEGNRPSFIEALRPESSSPLFALWNNILRESFPALQTGVFGADMKVSLLNDGPFTIWLDSEELFK